MCKYCDGNPEPEDICQVIKSDGPHTTECYIYLDGNRLTAEAHMPGDCAAFSAEVRFCPMCGRPLGGDAA